MQFISRNSQLVDRAWDSFSPIKRVSSHQLGVMNLEKNNMLTDDILDGIDIPSKNSVAKWIEENKVHQVRVLSSGITSTRMFLGAQVICSRDEVNNISHVVFFDEDKLIRVALGIFGEIERVVIHNGEVIRAHILINKFTCRPHVIYVVRDEGRFTHLYLDGKKVRTASKHVDFPFMCLSEVPIGHVQKENYTFGLISYKCRKTGRVFIRGISSAGVVGDERDVNISTCLGGMDFAINNDEVLFRVDAIENGKLVTKISKSTNRGISQSQFAILDLGGFEPDEFLPASSPVFKDYLGNFHVPVATLKLSKRHLFDVMDDVVVESLEVSENGYGYNLAKFPKKPGYENLSTARGRGNGVTDGLGIIATTLDKGGIYVSNSQSGGALYPQERLLNHEMPKAIAFKSTDSCYTRGVVPNTVSMDYLFLECDGDGAPVSNDLLIETWDMPLPPPIFNAVFKNGSVILNIVSDAWFEVGKTTFKFSDPLVEILGVNYIDERSVELAVDGKMAKGCSITFETRNLFYWHVGTAVIK